MQIQKWLNRRYIIHTNIIFTNIIFKRKPVQAMKIWYNKQKFAVYLPLYAEIRVQPNLTLHSKPTHLITMCKEPYDTLCPKLLEKSTSFAMTKA